MLLAAHKLMLSMTALPAPSALGYIFALLNPIFSHSSSNLMLSLTGIVNFIKGVFGSAENSLSRPIMSNGSPLIPS